MDKHKPISDALRKALQGLDVDTKGNLLRTSTTKSLATAKLPSLRQLNQRVLQTKAMTRQEREEEAKRLAIERRPKYPDARVMFMEHTLCLSCGYESEGVSHPLVFLRLRHLLPGGRFDPSQITYVPEKEYVESLNGARLPKLIEHHTSKVSSCPKCFTNAVHSFRGESIESSPPTVDSSPTPVSESELQSSISQTSMSPMDSFALVLSGIETSPTRTSTDPLQETPSAVPLISDSTSSASELPPAPAQPISSLIVEEQVHAVDVIGLAGQRAADAS